MGHLAQGPLPFCRLGNDQILLDPSTPLLTKVCSSFFQRPVSVGSEDDWATSTIHIRPMCDEASVFGTVTGTFGEGTWVRRGMGWEATGLGLGPVDVRCEGTDFLSYRMTTGSFIRFFMAHLAILRGGMSLHAASVARPEGAYVLMAHSGGGKTTFARTFGRQVILADDHSFIVPIKDRMWVWPSPFPGREGTAVTTSPMPLVGIDELAQDPRTWYEPLRCRDGLAALLAYAVVFEFDQTTRRHLLDNALAIVRHDQVGRLHFNLTNDPWEVLVHGQSV